MLAPLKLKLWLVSNHNTIKQRTSFINLSLYLIGGEKLQSPQFK